MSVNEQVRAEMQAFLQALVSHADRFASDPKLTFEEHHISLMLATRESACQPAARSAGAR